MAAFNVNINGLQQNSPMSRVKNGGGQSKFSGFRKGMLVDGVISQVSDRISIQLNGIEVQVESSAIQNAKEGETRTFEIMDVSEQGISLKEVGKNQASGNPAGVIRSTIVNGQAAHLIATAEEKRKEQKESESKGQAKDSAGDISSRMTGSDYGSIANENLSVDGMDINAFDAALDRAKEVHSIEQSMTSVNHASNFVPKEFQSDARQSAIAVKLMMANLPVTASNVTQITQELDNLDIINQMSDRTISYIVEMGLEPTTENLYRGSYAGILTFQSIADNTWQALKDTALDVISEAGLEQNDQNIKNAKWLLSNDLPLNAQSIQMVSDLQAVRGNISEDDCIDRMIDKMSKGFHAKTAVIVGGETPDPYVNKDLSNLKENPAVAAAAVRGQGISGNQSIESNVAQLPLDTDSLSENMYHMMMGQAGSVGIAGDNANVIAQLPGITDDAITKTIVQDRDVTLGNLIHAQDEINQGDTAYRSLSLSPANALAEIRAKRQLEEIRLKMTTEAGNRLAAKGIRLQTEGLQKVVEGLRQLEREYYQSYQTGNTDGMAEKMELFQKTTEAVFTLQQVPAFILGQSVATRNESTLNSLTMDASNMNLAQLKASNAYESLSTEVRKDLGDSLKKAFKNVDDILKRMKLEVTEANQRAVRILGYNHLKITEDSINEMKQYDGEVNYTLSKLHPAVAISMIREGLNPLDMPIPELNSQIDAIREREGITSEKKYTAYLWRLEKGEHFSKEEKNAFIGIYRLINAIKNSDGAAVGTVVDTGQELTLHNLLQAVRTLQNKNVDKKVDDSTGLSANPGESRDSIVKQILQGYVGRISADNADAGKETNEDISTVEQYAGTVAKNILDTITPDKLSSVWDSLDGNNMEDKMNRLLSMSLEHFAQEVNQAEESQEGALTQAEYNHEAAEHIRDILESSDAEIDYLLDRELPVSANMIDAVRRLSGGGKKFFEKLTGQAGEEERENFLEAADQLSEAFTDEESAKEAYEGFIDTAKDVMDGVMQSDTFSADDTWGLRGMNNMINLVSALAVKREQYHVPVQTEDGSVTSVNLTLIRGEGEKGKVHVDIESDKMGEIHADYKITKGRISGFIVCSSRAGQDAMKAQDPVMRKKFENAGLVMGSLNYVINSANTSYRASFEASEPDSGINTKVLYQTAKTVIEAVKSAENAA